jgi:hypothetical protein
MSRIATAIAAITIRTPAAIPTHSRMDRGVSSFPAPIAAVDLLMKSPTYGWPGYSAETCWNSGIAAL